PSGVHLMEASHLTRPLTTARLALQRIDAAREYLASGGPIDRTDDLLAEAAVLLANADADAEDAERIDLDRPPPCAWGRGLEPQAGAGPPCSVHVLRNGGCPRSARVDGSAAALSSNKPRW